MIRTMRWVLLAAAAAMAQVAAAQGERFPVKPIQVIITSTPGSASDAITRILGNEVTKTLGQPIVVVSKASAAGTIG
ncbi:MAG TPA: tripartite tricarboxylate transporter substrate binding protein, partial [Variovorax sp.]|nr:tripartite tricarboxylate transporter substrate binding protein [Variovorax sp.]